MKRIFAIVLCIVMALSVVACGDKEAEYKLGMGIVVSTEESKTGNAQVDATVATVVTDADGKIVSCRIDVAQNKMVVTDGAVETEKTFKTKMELGTAYGMSSSAYASDNNEDGVVKEWYEQAKAFESYVVGKTVAEVEAMTTKEAGGHQISTDDALLSAGCTIQITDFRDAVVKACKDDQGVTFTAVADSFTLGVAAKTTVDSSTKAATEEAEGAANMYTDFACAVVVDGKVVAALNDAIQPKIAISTTGEVTPAEFQGTKREIKEGYGMSGSAYASDNNEDGVIKEWYVQSAAFSNYVVGKTAAEISAMETQEAGGHQIAVDKALLDAGCTIQITDICAVVAQAVTNAR